MVVTEPESIPGPLARPRRRRKATLEDRLIARLLAPWLDRELASGTEPSISQAHAARADQLRGDSLRHAVAGSLDRLLDYARKSPRSNRLTPTAPRCRDQILVAIPEILTAAERLRSGEPLDARRVAQLKVLVRDRTGPCYVRSRSDALAIALGEISEPPRPA